MNSFWSPWPDVTKHPLNCTTPPTTFMSIYILISDLLLFLYISYPPYQILNNLRTEFLFLFFVKNNTFLFFVKDKIPKVLMYFLTCKYPFFLDILQNMEQYYTCTKILHMIIKWPQLFRKKVIRMLILVAIRLTYWSCLK